MRRFLFAVLFLLCPVLAFANTDVSEAELDRLINDLEGVVEGVELDKTPYDNIPVSSTPCASAAIKKGLEDKAGELEVRLEEMQKEGKAGKEMESFVGRWIDNNMKSKEILTKVLDCSEIKNAPEDKVIRFSEVVFEFEMPDNGNDEDDEEKIIKINWKAQPKLLKQYLLMANKRHLPEKDPNPAVGEDESVEWSNTFPAWYGVMVVEAGSLDDFVGPDKNNTVSLYWIEQNIDKLLPHSDECTSGSAFADDDEMINMTLAEKTVCAEKDDDGECDDPNDYYVYDDRDYRWIMYVEILADVVLTVVTFGAGTAISMSAKAARAAKAAKNVAKLMRGLQQGERVKNYIKIVDDIADVKKALKNIDATKDVAAYEKQMERIKTLERRAEILKADKNVKQYAKAADAMADVRKYYKSVQALRRAPQTGNVAVKTLRGLKAIRAGFSGGRTISRASRIGRQGIRSGRVRDWLYHSSMKFVSKFGRMEAEAGLLYSTVKFMGDMYDATDVSTSEYTSGIDFKPLLLLGADDLKGQENVVNYGMWLMWTGNSTMPEDDDAAYLQAMGFASMFHADLMQMQREKKAYPCNVDIFVVRPIIRNPGGEDERIYYLVMNDKPWSTVSSKYRKNKKDIYEQIFK